VLSLWLSGFFSERKRLRRLSRLMDIRKPGLQSAAVVISTQPVHFAQAVALRQRLKTDFARNADLRSGDSNG